MGTMDLNRFSGRMTYRQMAYLILNHFTEEQKNCDVTAADPLHDEYRVKANLFDGPDFLVTETGNCGAIGLSLVLPTSDECDELGLDEDHPVFIALETGE